MSPPTSTSPADSPVSPDSLPPTDPPARRRRGPAALRHRGFRQLTGAWVFTNIADSALFLMLAAWVKDLTGSDSAAAFVFAALGLPAFIAPFLGQLADRGLVSPWLAMWAPNIILTILGLIGLVRLSRESGSTRGGDFQEVLDSIRHLLRGLRRGRRSPERPV